MAPELPKEELLNKIEETAYNYEKAYTGCSRCALRAVQEHLNLGDDSAIMAVAPLAGGIAFHGDTCGALLGGLMAVGLATASSNMEDQEALQASLAAGYRLHRRFVREVGSSRCRDIQTAHLGRFYNFADPKEYERFKEAGGYNECAKIVGKAARLAAGSILDLREKEEAARG